MYPVRTVRTTSPGFHDPPRSGRTPARPHRRSRAARERGELAANTDVEGLAEVLTALDMGLMTYGVVAPGRTDPAQVSALLDRALR